MQKHFPSLNFSIKNLKILFLFFSILSFVPFTAFTASLSLSPQSSSYNVGASISMSIYASSPDQAMNAASGIISFPSDKLTVTSISKNGSIMGFWVQEPSFSNSAGTVNFEGIIFNPGFTGSSGKILTINFKVKAAGTASVTFSTGSVLANDGQGTNILTGMRSSTLTLKAVTVPVVQEKPKTTPTVASGTFSIAEVEREDPTDPKASFELNAKYKSPGVDYFEVQIDGGAKKVWKADLTNIYQTGVLSYGKHLIAVKAFDKNGGFLADSVSFKIEPLETPIITNYRPEVSNIGVVKVSGKTKYTNTDIKILLTKKDEDLKIYTIKSDANGNFIFIGPDDLTNGNYVLQAQVVDNRGATSEISKEVKIKITPTQLARVGSRATELFNVIVPLASLVFLFSFLVWFTWRKFKVTHQKFNRKIVVMEHNIHKAFELLKEDIREQVKMLERAKSKRQLTIEEDKIIKRFKADLDDTERFIKKEIESLERKMK